MVFFHADDYGICESQVSMINEGFSGALNSVSIMPNSPYMKEAIDRLSEKCIRRVVHLNFIEGKSCAAADKVSLLVDECGKLNCSFIKMLKYNYSFGKKKKEIFRQLCVEIEAQIKRVVVELKGKYTTEIALSIDSHQHLHMIPIVFKAMSHAINDMMSEKLIDQLDNIRISVDPIVLLIKKPTYWFRVPFKNYIKWIILRLVSVGERKQVKKMGGSVPVFWGIFFTCQMEKKIIDAFYGEYLQYSIRKKSDLELMFHPGAVYRVDDLLDSNQSDLVEFYSSEFRQKEKDALLNIGQ